jgi:hypothetical protein
MTARFLSGSDISHRHNASSRTNGSRTTQVAPGSARDAASSSISQIFTTTRAIAFGLQELRSWADSRQEFTRHHATTVA